MKFHFGLGEVVAIIIFALVATQIFPALTQIATLSDTLKIKQSEAVAIEAENLAKASITQADASARVAAAPRRIELELKAQESTIENARIRAQGEANAANIAAIGAADRDRSLGQSVILTVIVLFGIALLVVSYRMAEQIISARNFRHVVDIAARDGGKLELPNGHAITLLPRNATPAQITPGQTERVPVILKEEAHVQP